MTTNTTSPRCVATVVRPVRGRVRVRLPFAPDNRAMLKRWCGSGTRPEWRGGAWHVGRDHLEQILTGIARERCCAVTIHLEHATQTKCTASCWGAQPRTTWSCVCSCGGRNHGNGAPEISNGETGVVGTEYFWECYELWPACGETVQ